MKKNKMMRLASGLLVAVLLTSSVVSGTFAKYVTTGSANDSARVAKWGVTVEVTGNDAFAVAYNPAEDNTATDKGPGATVVSANEENVVAPGTKGNLGSIDINGQPEVDVNVTITPTFTLGEDWAIDGEFYCPLIIAGIDGTNYFGDREGFIAAVTAQFTVDRDVDANVDLGTTFDKTTTWEWAFNGNDTYDTILGNTAATEGSDLSVSLTVEVTVTQID